jgi:coproporphyrinogen III oxidase-like Fe-S oxidoreductase
MSMKEKTSGISVPGSSTTGPYIRKKTTTSEILNNDEEKEKVYQKIVELLMAAGYFRARISSLEPFDKVRNIIYI